MTKPKYPKPVQVGLGLTNEMEYGKQSPKQDVAKYIGLPTVFCVNLALIMANKV